MLLCQGVYQFPWENRRAGSVLTCNKKVVQTRGLRSSTTAVQWAGDAINKRWVDSDRDQQIFCAPMYFLPYFWPICNWQHPLVTAVQLTRMSSKNLHASFIRLPNAHLLSSSLMQLDCPAAQSTSQHLVTLVTVVTFHLLLQLLCCLWPVVDLFSTFSLARCLCHIHLSSGRQKRVRISSVILQKLNRWKLPWQPIEENSVIWPQQTHVLSNNCTMIPTRTGTQLPCDYLCFFILL